MPQEFLRDVLRTGDGTGRRRRGWSVLPLSIAGHAVVLTVFLFSPWTSEVELPVIASPLPERSSRPSRRLRLLLRLQELRRPCRRRIGCSHRGSKRHHPREPGTPARHDRGWHLGRSWRRLRSAAAQWPECAGPGPDAATPPIPPKPQRVGGLIREPRKILHVAPLYPDIARQSRVEGTVVLEAVLDVTGRVESVRVLGSQPLLDDAAVRAVRQWRYTPTELNGVPVPVLMTITVRFSLER